MITEILITDISGPGLHPMVVSPGAISSTLAPTWFISLMNVFFLMLHLGLMIICSWWINHGKLNYPDATSILMLMDGGGSNSSRHYIFKQDLQVLSDRLGVKIRVAHYPPYTSKSCLKI